MATSEAFELESALAELEQLVNRMEHENLPLEEALKCFEHGVSLTKQCQQVLKLAEQKIISAVKIRTPISI